MTSGAWLVVVMAATAPVTDVRAPSTESRVPNTDSRLPNADYRTPTTELRNPNSDVRSPTSDFRDAAADEPPPSAYDRARQDEGKSPETTSLVGQFIKTLVALGIVIALIWVIFKYGAARLLPGAVGPRSGRLVRVVERVLVDQRSSLLVIDVGAERMLLGVAEGSVSFIAHLDQTANPESTQPRARPAGFRGVLEAISPKKSSEDDNAPK